MSDWRISASVGARKGQVFSRFAGFVIASACFALLFAAMSRLIPLFFRFIHSPRSGLLRAIVLSVWFLAMAVGGLIRYFRGRVKVSSPAVDHRFQYSRRWRLEAVR
jgi:uncharacterized membrane protein